MKGKENHIKVFSKAASFAEAEEIDIAFSAVANWEENVSVVEEMRKSIWEKEYKIGRIAVGRVRSLKSDEDEFE